MFVTGKSDKSARKDCDCERKNSREQFLLVRQCCLNNDVEYFSYKIADLSRSIYRRRAFPLFLPLPLSLFSGRYYYIRSRSVLTTARQLVRQVTQYGIL